MRLTCSAAILGVKLGLVGLSLAVSQTMVGGLVRADSPPAKPGAVTVGAEIFNREWMPNDPRGHGGDGLGPVYNDSSCVACHNSGGSGGAGPTSKNIDILNASAGPAVPVDQLAKPSSSTHPSQQNRSAVAALLDALTDVHPGFRTSRTVVLHKFGIDPNYDSWRSQALRPAGMINSKRIEDTAEVQQSLLDLMSTTLVLKARNIVDAAGDGRAMARIQQIQAAVLANNPGLRQPAVPVGVFSVSRSQRNPTALFGLGLVDAIPDAAIEAIAKRQTKESPEIQGRISRLKDGRIGRLGWKGQTANAEDFVLNACAVELGLEVPGHHQAMTPQAPKYQTTGLDLTSEECAALTAYVRSLPRPVERPAAGAVEAKFLASGRTTFSSIGCAGCHAPNLGKVEGIYSDLLLHDMGADTADDGSYSDGSDGSDEPLVPIMIRVADGRAAPPKVPPALRGATRQEWRTPPLWGFRDSGPYLHDGRAQTLEQAVAMHGGQAATSARKFLEIAPRERLQVEAFLKSLVAPQPVQLAQRGD